MSMSIKENDYVDIAEKVIINLAKNKDKYGNTKMVTTSKLRNLLAMSADIYNEVLVSDEKLSEDLISRIDYLRVRFIYEYGRDNKGNSYKGDLQKFIDDAKILDILKEINGSKKNYILFYHYMEALVAFHKYNGGRD